MRRTFCSICLEALDMLGCAEADGLEACIGLGVGAGVAERGARGWKSSGSVSNFGRGM